MSAAELGVSVPRRPVIIFDQSPQWLESKTILSPLVLFLDVSQSRQTAVRRQIRNDLLQSYSTQHRHPEVYR